ncbi:Bax inhibitor-1/YccA family protein [Iodidimonas sp. SYSU 1G8]|uniref:Bax inhibitor-1/YccA family protein n=1 Tax=Iodidimonas sp. SYSU 1G8 TaxID=3133967 RepID=UPI0031FF291E
MAQDYRTPYSVGAGTAAEIDQGLRSYMLGVYNYMASGVLLTGIIALLVSNMAVTDAGELTSFGQAIYMSPLKWVVLFAPLGLVLLMSFGVNKLSVFALQATFWVYAALMGLSLSSIFMIYTGESIARVFFISAAMFGSLSLYGYTTKRDLGPVGKFLFMGLIGIIIASVVNLFVASSMLSFVVSVIGVLVFAGLTAYDTQRIKEQYYEGHGEETLAKLSLMGALTLYLDFINLFLMMLRLFGSSRE